MTATAPGDPTRFWKTVTESAEFYERELVPALFEPWAAELVELVGPQPGERVLDLACGTGLMARKAAARLAGTGQVVGVDLSPGMLAVAHRSAAGVEPAIQWRQASALDTGLPDESIDVAFCQQGLQFFADRMAALRELHRVMAPDGRLAVSVWCDPYAPGYAPLWPAFEQHLADLPAALGFLRAVFALDDAEELRGLLTDTGFRDVRVSRHTHDVRAASAEAWAAAFLGAAPVPGLAEYDPKVLGRIADEVVAALRPYVDGDGLTFPISANVALARRQF